MSNNEFNMGREMTRLKTHDEDQDKDIKRMFSNMDRHIRECTEKNREHLQAEKDLGLQVKEVATKLDLLLKFIWIGGGVVLLNAIKEIAVTFLSD